MAGISVPIYGQGLTGMGMGSMEYPAYPGYAPQTTGLDQRHSPTPSLTLSTSTRDSSSLDGSPDILARYRAEQILRSNPAPGVSLPGIGTIAGGSYPAAAANTNPLGLAATTSSQAYPPPSTTAGGLTGLYHDSNSAWQQGQASYQTADHSRKDYNVSGRLSFPPPLSQSQHLSTSAPNAASSGYAYHPTAAGSQYSFRDSQHQHQQERPRAGSEDSVTNSSVEEYANGRPHSSHAYPSGSSSPSRQQHQQQQAHEQQNHHHQDFYTQARRGSLPQDGEGGFSSAFGLMSLDDPAVLAGLQSDGAPFFSDLHPSGTVSAVGGPQPTTGDRSQRSSFSSTASFSGN